MRGIRFWLIGIVSFITVTIGTVFVPGSFFNRVFSVTFCTILSFNSTFCPANLWLISERVVAASAPKIEIKNNPLDNITYLAQQQSSSSPILLKQGTLQTGGSLLPDQRLFDSYNFLGRAGQSIVITLESQDFDPYLQLLDSQGKKIAESGNTIRKIIKINSTIKIILPRNDTYRVIVTSHDAKGQGRYTLTVNNLDDSRALSLATPEGCKIVLNTKNINGKLFDYIDFLAKDKTSCGNSFTSLVDSDGNGLTANVNTDNGITTYEMKSNLPGQGVEIQIAPSGEKPKIYSGKFEDGIYRFTYDDGENKPYVFDIPKDSGFYSNIQNSPEALPEKHRNSESYDCKAEREFCKKVEDFSDAIANLEIATLLFFPLVPVLAPFAGAVVAGLEIGDLTLSIDRLRCFISTGKTPPVPLGGMFKRLGEKIMTLLPALDALGIFSKSSFGKKIISDLMRKERTNEVYNEAAMKEFTGVEENGLRDLLNKYRKDNGLSAPCEDLVSGGSNNDPHLTTFDGLKYDLQTVGEFTLIKSSSGAFEVQARQTPWNNSASVSINSAVAMKVGSDRVAIYAQGLPDADTSTPLRVNGKPTTIQGDKLTLQGGGEILRQGSTYVVSAPTGEKVLVSSSGSFLNISPYAYKQSGRYSGLLGNVNGNPNDDLQVRGGSNVLEVRSTYGDVKKVLNLVGLRAPGALDRAEQVYFDQLYKQFANSWRVKQEESLFDYPPGKTTQSYVNPGFPDKYLTLNMLSADQIQKAQNACTEAKVTPDLMEGCIFDVGFSGFSEFARATAEINSYVGIVNQLFPSLKIPTPEQAVDRVIERVKPRVCLPFVGCH